MLRLRSNGHSLFNNDEIRIEDPDDKLANIGLLMLMKETNNISVSYAMGFTVITIKL